MNANAMSLATFHEEMRHLLDKSIAVAELIGMAQHYKESDGNWVLRPDTLQIAADAVSDDLTEARTLLDAFYANQLEKPSSGATPSTQMPSEGQ